MTNIFEIREQVLSGKKTAVEFVEEALAKAENAKEFNAFTSLIGDRALERAKSTNRKT